MNVLVDGEIVLHGTVGDDFWGEGFTPRDVLNALVELGRDSDVTVRINSGGGIALDGVAIYNTLAAHGGNVTVVIEGIAASAASIIAMGGDTIIMRTGTLMMIHDPSSITWGTAADHDKSSEVLDKLGDQLASIYAARTGAEISEMRDAMKDETWLTPDEARDGGFADQVESEAAAEATAFDYRLYEHAPENLVALAAANSWGSKRRKPPAKPSASKPTAHKAKATAKASDQPKAARSQMTMTKKETEAPATADAGEARSEERKRIGAIMNSEQAKGRTGLAEYFAYETEMTAEDAIKALARAPAEDKAPAPVKEEPTAKAEAPSILGLELGSAPAPASAKATINTSAIYASRRKQSAA